METPYSTSCHVISDEKSTASVMTRHVTSATNRLSRIELSFHPKNNLSNKQTNKEIELELELELGRGNMSCRGVPTLSYVTPARTPVLYCTGTAQSREQTADNDCVLTREIVIHLEKGGPKTDRQCRSSVRTYG